MRRTRRTSRTPEESRVELSCLVAFLLGFAAFDALIYANPSPDLFMLGKMFGAVGTVSGIFIAIFMLHTVFSFILAFVLHFSTKQLRLLARFVLLVDTFFPFSAIFAFASVVFAYQFAGPSTVLIVLLGVGYIALVFVLIRVFGSRISRWYRGDYAREDSEKKL